jgi:hypothetical protein
MSFGSGQCNEGIWRFYKLGEMRELVCGLDEGGVSGEVEGTFGNMGEMISYPTS